MSIKLTKTINGKKVTLDLISLDGQAKIRDTNFQELKKQGITKKQLEAEGFSVEVVK